MNPSNQFILTPSTKLSSTSSTASSVSSQWPAANTKCRQSVAAAAGIVWLTVRKVCRRALVCCLKYPTVWIPPSRLVFKLLILFLSLFFLSRCEGTWRCHVLLKSPLSVQFRITGNQPLRATEPYAHPNMCTEKAMQGSRAGVEGWNQT